MHYQTKLYLAFSGLIVTTILLSEGLSYKETRQKLLNELSSKVVGVAATMAQLLDRDQVEIVVKEGSDQSDVYDSLVQKMRNVRDANRRDDFFVKYIYMIRPDPANAKQFIVVADATEDPAIYIPPGTAYPEGGKFGILDHLNEPFSPPKLIEDRWGKFLPGYAPIFDANGKFLATIGVNLSADYVDQEVNRLLLIDFWTMSIALIAGLLIATFLAHGISRSLRTICSGVSRIGRGELEARLDVHSKDEFGELALEINRMAQGLQERDRLKLNFTRYVSKHILEKILASDKMPTLEGERRKITVLFSDIRDFTHLAEYLPPEEVVLLLNEYLAVMLDVIFSKNGTLDKFIGDGLMVEFGAPLDDSEQEIHAVETALGMHQALKTLNQKWKMENRPEISMGIGIHTGLAVLGNIGSEHRMEYTAIGDTVNVTSRLEQATKELKVSILISETTWTAISTRYQGKSMGPLHLKGRIDPVNVYAIDLPEERGTK